MCEGLGMWWCAGVAPTCASSECWGIEMADSNVSMPSTPIAATVAASCAEFACSNACEHPGMRM